MLFVVIGLMGMLCGAVLCGYGIAVTRNRKAHKRDGGSSTDTEKQQQRIDELEQSTTGAVTTATTASQSIQDIIADIRKRPINNNSSNGGN